MDSKTADPFVLGVDYGTSSVRALLLHAGTGEEAASSESGFPRWDAGRYSDPAASIFRQHPGELLEAFSEAVSAACRKAGRDICRRIAGMTVDTTGSTPCAVDRSGAPLALSPEFNDEPDAMFILWKDHSARAEAEEITERSRVFPGTDYLAYCGGLYSAEWYWAKILHVLRSNRRVADAASSWVEHCDWFAGLLSGNTDPRRIARSRCAAGHKALWNSAFGGYPPAGFFRFLDPVLERFREGLPADTITADRPAGRLCREWAGRLGLPEGILVGTGLFDAHAAALGAGIGRGTIIKVMGTSSSDMVVVDGEVLGPKAIRGIESQAEGTMIPGMISIEAGQSAFGDIYAWFRDLLAFPLEDLRARGRLSGKEIDEAIESIIPALSKSASRRGIREDLPVALDWFNGRRAPFADHRVKAGLAGLGLDVDAPEFFRSLVFATAFGTRAIHDLLRREGVPIEKLVAVGGIPRKAPFVMQALADVLYVDVVVGGTPNASARGAALLAAVAGGLYPDTEAAVSRLSGGTGKTYRPAVEHRPIIDALYQKYLDLGRFIDYS
jgi:L-ribulokinase